MNFIQSLLHLLQHGRSTQKVIYTSLDDELFANRERAYGSYELRKNQSWYLLTATGLVLSSVLCLVFVPIWMGWHLEETTDPSQFPQIDEFIFVDREPQPLNLSEIQRRIHFPQGHPSGHVVFRVLVDAQGHTVNHQLIKASEDRFIEALAPHIDDLRWTPAIQEGKAIPFWVNIPFAFRGLN